MRQRSMASSSMTPPQAFAVGQLQALVQRGGLAEMEHALRSHDPSGSGFLSRQEIHAALPSADYVRLADAADYRRQRIISVRRPFFQRHVLDDLLSIAGRDARQRINYVELLELGASLQEVQGLNRLMSEGFVQILGQENYIGAEGAGGGYSQAVVEGKSPVRPSGGAAAKGGDDPAALAAPGPLRRPARMPWWWLTWQMSWWLVQFATFNLLMNILVPFRVIELVGEASKAHYLALVNVVVNAVALTGPVFGAASDAVPRNRWGRRRPFIVVGQAGTCVGLYLMMVAPTIGMLEVGACVFCLGNSMANAIYQTVIAELVPPEQRGTAGGFFMVFQTLGNLASSGVGYLVGDAYMTESQAYLVLIVANAVDTLIGLSGLGIRPSLCGSEAPPPTAAAPDAVGPQSPLRGRAAGRSRGCGAACCDFFSAFRSGSYTALFFFMFFCASIQVVQMQFFAYWVEDKLAPNDVRPAICKGQNTSVFLTV